MLSLSAFSHCAPFCRAQHGVDGVQPTRFPAGSAPNFSNWLVAGKDPIDSRTIEGKPSNNCRDNPAHPQNETEAKCAEPVPAPRLSPRSDHTASQGKSSCTAYPSPMNGANDLVMTGSSNPRAEQLSWLAEVATGAVRTGQNSSPSSPGHGKDAGPPLLHNSEPHPQRSSLNSILLGVNQRLYAPYPPERFHPGSHQTSGSSGNRLSLYYSQAPRTTPYSGFYPGEHRLPYGQVMTDGLLAPRRLPHPYFQNELYSPAITSITNVQMPSAHCPMPHSPSYLHPTASLSPGGMSPSPSSPRMPQPPGPILVSRTVEVMGAYDHEKSPLSLQAARGSPQYHREDRRKSYKSPEPKNLSPSLENLPVSGMASDMSASKEAPLRQNTSPPHLTYKVPTGKEGSLKHRILRPPSINIVDPPPTVLDAPLSAPPIRSHREPSPKQMKQESYGSYSPFTPSGAFVIEGSHLLTQQPVAAPSFIMAGGASAAGHSLAPATLDSGSALKYPHAFMKGSIIQLANSQLKPVELMTTEDFLECEALSSNLKIDSSSVVCIEKMPATGSAKLGFAVGPNKLQITVEAPLEHPFFVYKQGWSSCSPERSLLRYRLPCNKLKVGDTCIFLTVKSDKPAVSKSDGPPGPPNLVPTTPQDVKGNATSDAPHLPPLDKGPPAVPFSRKAIATSSEQREESSAVPKKRKRRWSAPCAMTPPSV